uniref:Uncharacterized protein n=1 Tax=Phenylobacterium glaciei TaxID=2803784 RepID=A0A974P122_9CAUL|nr:hypothetical protein JKL49_14530 [Phenylobacterium glaciei]
MAGLHSLGQMVGIEEGRLIGRVIAVQAGIQIGFAIGERQLIPDTLGVTRHGGLAAASKPIRMSVRSGMRVCKY